MNKKIAKLLAILFCLTLIGAAFAGCTGKKETTAGEETPTPSATESTPAEEPGIWLPTVENK